MLGKVYIFFSLMLPILFQYSAGISTITLGDALLLILSVVVLFSHDRLRMNHALIAVFSFSIFALVLTLLFPSGDGALMTNVRYLFYIFVIIIASGYSEHYDFAVKMYSFLGIATSVLLILQVILINGAGIYLPGVIESAPLMDESLYTYSETIHAQTFKRCMSCFTEPSHYAIYAIGSVVAILFYEKFSAKRKILAAAFVTIAIALSTSFTGVITVALVWAWWLKKYINRRALGKIMVFLFVSFLFLLVFLNTSAGKYIFNLSILLRQAGGRMEGFEFISNDLANCSIRELILGHGMSDIGIGTQIYLAGYPRMIYYFGILGTIIFIICFMCMIRRSRKLTNAFLLTILVLSVATEMIFASFLVPYLVVALLEKDDAVVRDGKGLLQDEY